MIRMSGSWPWARSPRPTPATSTSKLPTWNDFVHHPNYDQFWLKQAVARFLTRPKVPTLNVAGWWDQEDFYGPLKIYETWEKQDSDRLSTLVVGPWNHGGWSHGTGDHLGPIKFDAPTAWQYPREDPAAVLRALPQGPADRARQGIRRWARPRKRRDRPVAAGSRR